MAYQCVAASVAGFIQQLAAAYVANGYYFYVTGYVPLNTDPASLDQKMIRQYGLRDSKWIRVKRKKQNIVAVQYLRYRNFFALLATRREHPCFATEGRASRDLRECPMYFMGYSIGCRLARHGPGYQARVRMHRGICHELKVHFEGIATQRSVPELCRELQALDLMPYPPVRGQVRRILRAINRRRQVAGLPLVPRQAL